MLARLRDFVTRHRRKFIITGVLVGGTYIALKYVQKKLIEMQERQAREFMEKSRRIQHFESTQKTCNQVIIGMGVELVQAILKECSTHELLKQLRENPPNKLEIWEEMKIVSFTRLTALIYASSMLVVALRIKMNLLGGYLYSDTVAGLVDEQNQQQVKPKKITDDLKQKYLSLIKHFIEDGGLSELVHLIRSKVITVLKDVPLTRCLSLADMEQLFWSLQMSINSDPNTDPCSKMSKYLLPSQLEDYAHGDPLLQKILNDTLDLLESDDASSVCSNNICRGFSLAVDAIAESMGESVILAQKQAGDNSESSKNSSKQMSNGVSLTNESTTSATTSDSLLNINRIQMALAKVIPIICGITAKGFDGTARPQNLPSSLITFYLVSEKSKILGANVYETFSSA